MGDNNKLPHRVIVRSKCDDAYNACITAPVTELDTQGLTANIFAIAVMNDSHI